VDGRSFRCGQMSVRREAANVLPIIAGTSAVGVRLGQCHHISMSKLCNFEGGCMQRDMVAMMASRHLPTASAMPGTTRIGK
jgi:hypothetical protein